MGENENQPETDKDIENVQEPDLLDTYGTFPVWMLKVIQLVPPSFLIAPNPPKDEDTKS